MHTESSSSECDAKLNVNRGLEVIQGYLSIGLHPAYAWWRCWCRIWGSKGGAAYLVMDSIIFSARCRSFAPKNYYSSIESRVYLQLCADWLIGFATANCGPKWVGFAWSITQFIFYFFFFASFNSFLLKYDEVCPYYESICFNLMGVPLMSKIGLMYHFSIRRLGHADVFKKSCLSNLPKYSLWKK